MASKRKKLLDENINSIIDITNYEDNEAFELNMNLLDKFIEYITYKIECFKYTIEDIKKDNLYNIYDIKKLKNVYDILIKIKEIIFMNKQEGLLYKDAINKVFKDDSNLDINGILSFDVDVNNINLDIRKLPNKELDEYIIRTKKYKKYPPE